MFRKMLKSKIHRARITQANLNYEGSVTIPIKLLQAANILAYEAVNVWNINAGTRFETYAIIDPNNNSNEICINGAAAHLVSINDLIIIASFIQLEESYCAEFKPKVVFVNYNNQILNTDRLEISYNIHG